jgi:hypothetical protein
VIAIEDEERSVNDTKTSPERKLALHEYPRGFTSEQLAQASQLVAEGKSIAYVAREMGLTDKRAKTLMSRIDVMNTAIKLRETSTIPNALSSLVDMAATIQNAILDLSRRQTAVEVALGRTAKAMAMKRIQAERNKATMKKLRSDNRALRDLIRKRGFV